MTFDKDEKLGEKSSMAAICEVRNTIEVLLVDIYPREASTSQELLHENIKNPLYVTGAWNLDVNLHRNLWHCDQNYPNEERSIVPCR